MSGVDESLAPGTLLSGRFRLERTLGRGAMGVVYEATEIALRRRVAVKVVACEGADVRERFAREARAAARLTSEHVARVLAVDLEADPPYLAMEYLEGRTLEAVLEREGPQPIAAVLDWLAQILEAVAEAHALGLVHRDLKPSNVFLAERAGGDPVVKVLDFGVVKDAAAGRLTETGATMGTPAYMAPEQIRAEARVDARADVWALGVVAFELLTGELPFPATSIPQMLLKILHDAPVSLRARRPDVPEGLDALVARCLARDPGARFADGAELAREVARLRAALAGVGEASAPARVVVAPTSRGGAVDPLALTTAEPPRAETTERTRARRPSPRPRRSTRLVFVVSALVGVGLPLVVGAGMWIARRPASVATDAAAAPAVTSSAAPAETPARATDAGPPAPIVEAPTAPPASSTNADATAPTAAATPSVPRAPRRARPPVVRFVGGGGHDYDPKAARAWLDANGPALGRCLAAAACAFRVHLGITPNGPEVTPLAQIWVNSHGPTKPCDMSPAELACVRRVAARTYATPPALCGSEPCEANVWFDVSPP